MLKSLLSFVVLVATAITAVNADYAQARQFANSNQLVNTRHRGPEDCPSCLPGKLPPSFDLPPAPPAVVPAVAESPAPVSDEATPLVKIVLCVMGAVGGIVVGKHAADKQTAEYDSHWAAVRQAVSSVKKASN